MSYPSAIDTKELMACLKDKENIAWALINEKGGLVQRGGNVTLFGLDQVEVGKYLADHFYCLEGLIPLAGTPYEIYELEISPNKFINIYCLPTDEGDRIIFHDISEMANIKNMIHKKTQEVMVFLDNYRRNTS
jgi:hypothetical protein